MMIELLTSLLTESLYPGAQLSFIGTTAAIIMGTAMAGAAVAKGMGAAAAAKAQGRALGNAKAYMHAEVVQINELSDQFQEDKNKFGDDLDKIWEGYQAGPQLGSGGGFGGGGAGRTYTLGQQKASQTTATAARQNLAPTGQAVSPQADFLARQVAVQDIERLQNRQLGDAQFAAAQEARGEQGLLATRGMSLGASEDVAGLIAKKGAADAARKAAPYGAAAGVFDAIGMTAGMVGLSAPAAGAGGPLPSGSIAVQGQGVGALSGPQGSLAIPGLSSGAGATGGSLSGLLGANPLAPPGAAYGGPMSSGKLTFPGTGGSSTGAGAGLGLSQLLGQYGQGVEGGNGGAYGQGLLGGKGGLYGEGWDKFSFLRELMKGNRG